MKWIKVFSHQEILTSDNFLKSVRVSGKKLCMVKVEGSFYAVQNKCPHAGADLSQGWCSEGKLVCPFHRHKFNLETGRGDPGQGDYLNTYPVELREDGVYVGIRKPWWKIW